MHQARIDFVDVEPTDERLVRDVLPVLAQLRPNLDAGLIRTVYEEGHPQGLRFTAVHDSGECVAVAGWRVVATTVCVRKLYVDDIVTIDGRRGRGVGTMLFEELRRRAREAGCFALDLDCGLTRSDAHRFYARQRMAITAFHFGGAVDAGNTPRRRSLGPPAADQT